MLFDIHSHILPATDDGAEDIIESLHLLEMMQSQGITDCIATPHFYPSEDNLEDFLQVTRNSFERLKKIANERKLPNIYLGCEMLYYEGIGKSDSLDDFRLNGSEFLLLELYDGCITDTFFEDLTLLYDEQGITPIIAHIERYCDFKNYKKLLKFAKEKNIPVQINAVSFIIPSYIRVIKKIFKNAATCLIATDAHSVETRPPRMAEALREVNLKFGREYRTRLMNASEYIYKKIVTEKD